MGPRPSSMRNDMSWCTKRAKDSSTEVHECFQASPVNTELKRNDHEAISIGKALAEPRDFGRPTRGCESMPCKDL